MTAVVFDLDGTLVDTMTHAPRAYADTIRELGGPVLSPEQVVAVWHIGPTVVVLEHFLGRVISDGDLDCFHRHFDAAVAAVRPFPGVVDMLAALQRENVRLGVYTTATRRAANRMLGTTGLAGIFPVVVGGDEVDAPKPSPAGLELACRRLGVQPMEAIYVGDAEVDLLCAAAAGALAVFAGWGAPAAAGMPPHHPARHPGDVVRIALQQSPAGRSGAGGLQP